MMAILQVEMDAQMMRYSDRLQKNMIVISINLLSINILQRIVLLDSKSFK